MRLPPDLAAMLSAFADAGVRYLIVGGHRARSRSGVSYRKTSFISIVTSGNRTRVTCSPFERLVERV
jgi:hypothetical protein